MGAIDVLYFRTLPNLDPFLQLAPFYILDFNMAFTWITVLKWRDIDKFNWCPIFIFVQSTVKHSRRCCTPINPISFPYPIFFPISCIFGNSNLPTHTPCPGGKCVISAGRSVVFDILCP
jgi:hypothetical protein